MAQHLHVMRENIGPHGVPMEQAFDGANKGRFRVDATVDLAALAVAQTQASYREQYKHQGSEFLDSLRWTAHLVTDEDEPS